MGILKPILKVDKKRIMVVVLIFQQFYWQEKNPFTVHIPILHGLPNNIAFI